MKNSFKILIILLIFIIFPRDSFASAILSSIKPIDSLVKMIVSNPKNTALLVNNNKSPHGFSLKPSDVKKIKEAKIIFYIDDSFEIFLSKALENSDHVKKVSLLQKSNLRLLKVRNDEDWHSKKSRKSNGNIDYHVWLDTKNAKKILKTIRNELIKSYPQNAQIYKNNYKIAVKKMDDLYEDLRDQLNNVRDKEFIVFHDASQYFEEQFHLNNVSAITTNPHFNVSIKRLKKNRLKARSESIKCVFYEPHFNKKFSNMVAKSSKAKIAKLDPIGFNLEPSKNLYFTLMRNLGDSYYNCLL